MTNSSGESTRVELAPPRESPGRPHRTGYLALTAAGLLLCTAFATVAQVAAPEEDTGDRMAAPTDGLTDDNRSGGGGPELIPGRAVPADTTVVVDGVPVTGTLPSSTDAPTTVVRVGDDGEETTSVVPPPDDDGDEDSDSGQGDRGESDPSNPGPQPGPTDTDTEEPSDPTDPTSPTGSPTDPTSPTEDDDNEDTTTESDSGDGDPPEEGGGGSSSPAATTLPDTTGDDPGTMTGTVGTRTPVPSGSTGSTGTADAATAPTGGTGTGTDRPSR